MAFWQRLASALLSAVWHLVDQALCGIKGRRVVCVCVCVWGSIKCPLQAFGESLLRLQLAELARVVGAPGSGERKMVPRRLV